MWRTHEIILSYESFIPLSDYLPSVNSQQYFEKLQEAYWFFPILPTLWSSVGILSNISKKTSLRREVQNFCYCCSVFLDKCLLWSFVAVRLLFSQTEKKVWSQGEKQIKNGSLKAIFSSTRVEIKACPAYLVCL